MRSGLSVGQMAHHTRPMMAKMEKTELQPNMRMSGGQASSPIALPTSRDPKTVVTAWDRSLLPRPDVRAASVDPSSLRRS